MSPDPSRWGVEPGFTDYRGGWREASGPAVDAALRAMGADSESPGDGGGDDVVVVRPGEGLSLPGRWSVRHEDGSGEEVEGGLTARSLGYLDLTSLDDGRRVLVVVAPEACHLPDGLRAWGWAAQLHSFRSAGSWGMGDLADLRRLGEWASGRGASLVMVNPLHAPLPGLPVQPSPYFAASRCFRNPIYLRVEEVPGAEGCPTVAEAARAAHRLNGDRHIHRDAVWTLKSEALEAAWERFRQWGGAEAHEFADFRRRGGDNLAGFATFAVLTEVHGRGWQHWPEEHRRPDSAAVARFASDHADRIGFHAWLQWLVDRQIAAAGSAIGVVNDLAIGVDPAGADAWLWQDSFALGARVGAPPDEFNTLGQDWG
ncbi:MAG TPA: 4-alpha-glucanotransferase, partial [Acidimicrobiales bacterium]|nr:4-alpha-glucanotransferase [Acidimicrobiales bacterium]